MAFGDGYQEHIYKLRVGQKPGTGAGFHCHVIQYIYWIYSSNIQTHLKDGGQSTRFHLRVLLPPKTQRQASMRYKIFTYAERIGVYAKGERAFIEGRQRSYNPYIASKDLAGLWWHGWDTAEGKSKRAKSPFEERPISDTKGRKQ